MGNRWFNDRCPDGITGYGGAWYYHKPGHGKWCKRQLHKARRRFWKLYCKIGERAYKHTGSLYGWEATVNWRDT